MFQKRWGESDCWSVVCMHNSNCQFIYLIIFYAPYTRVIYTFHIVFGVV